MLKKRDAAMLSDSNLSSALNLALLIVGCVLLLRKIVEIEGYHRVRVFVLTAIFSSPFILFGVYVYYQLNPPTFFCGGVISINEEH